jgi:hypothetical protein
MVQTLRRPPAPPASLTADELFLLTVADDTKEAGFLSALRLCLCPCRHSRNERCPAC